MNTSLAFLASPAWLRRATLATALLLSPGLRPAALALPPAPPAGVQQLDPLTYRVWASNPSGQPGLVQVLNLDTNQVLFETHSTAVSFGHKFDMGQLPDGRYAFVVRVGGQQCRYALRLRTAAARSAELRADTVGQRAALSARR